MPELPALREFGYPFFFSAGHFMTIMKIEHIGAIGRFKAYRPVAM
jgi:hypothetical protein